MRQAFARFLQEGTEGGLTNGEHIIRTLIQKAKEGDMRAIEYVLDRMGGKPLQAVEVATEHSFDFLSDAERIRITGSIEKIKRMQAEADAAAARHLGGVDLTLLPSASECDQQAGRPTRTPPREDFGSVPSPRSELQPRSVRNTQVSSYGLSPFEQEKQKRPVPCPHGLRQDHCLICNNI
jgi:hypothetical protein